MPATRHDQSDLIIRAATPADAPQVAAVMNAIIAEGHFDSPDSLSAGHLTLFDRPFSDDEERAFISSLGPRSVLHVADVAGEIVGVQSVDSYSGLAASLRHVATMGTWLRADMRGRNIGRALAVHSFVFAKTHGYRKIVISVLASNERALRFYGRLGFTVIGVARDHVELGGIMHDEVFMECAL